MVDKAKLRVVLFRERNFWVAQCLEYDIGVQAGDLRELDSRLQFALEAEREESLTRSGTPFAGIDQAPQFFQDMWNRCAGSYKPRMDSADQSKCATQYDMAIVS